MLSVYKRLLMPIYVPSLSSSMVHTATIILLPLYLLEAGYGIAIASFAVALRGLGILIADIPAGLIANRYGDKPAMLLGSLSLLGAMILLGASESLVIIYLASILLGVSNALNMIGRLSYITDVSARHERGRAIALMAGLQRGGALLGPLLFSLVAKHLSYQTAFVIMSVLGMLNLSIVMIFSENIVAHHRKSSPVSAMFRVLIKFKGILFKAGFAGLTLMMLRAGRQLLFPLFGHSYGLDVVQIGILFSISSAVDVCLFYPAGQIMDKKGRKWTAIPGSIILALSVMLLPIIPSYNGMLIFAILSGLGNGITTGVLLTIGTDLAPEAERNQFMGLWRLQLDAGQALAPFMVGTLTQTLSLAIATWSIAGLGFTGATVLGIFVKETLDSKPGSGE